jgi:arginine decarboxylase
MGASMNIYDNLLQYVQMGYYPMHMPGHKRNTELLQMVNPYFLDITEIDGFDNLHRAEGILLQGMKRAARLYGSEHTNYLVGGSTSGILTAISAAAKKGDKVLVARNSHKSVYHGIYLRELNPVYLYPDLIDEFGINGGIFPEKVEEMLIKHPDIKLIIITSPTYEGVVSDIKSIAEIGHKYGIPLMVDEAHGAHLGFHPGFPKSSIKCGADLVIHSVHKTLPAFTQSALIHVNGKLINYEEVKRFLAIYQSTSPSYLLMAGIDQCVALLEDRGDELFFSYYNLLSGFYERMKGLKSLKLLTKEAVTVSGFFDFDPSKITISVKNTSMTGNEIYQILLTKYRIQLEMLSKDYALGMTSIGDTEEGFTRLGDALLEIDALTNKNIYEDSARKKEESHKGSEPDNNSCHEDININSRQQEQEYNTGRIIKPEMVMTSHEAYEQDSEVIPIKLSDGRVALEYVYLYPPGIPLLVPGEKITQDFINNILKYQEAGLTIQGLTDMEGILIKVALR